NQTRSRVGLRHSGAADQLESYPARGAAIRLLAGIGTVTFRAVRTMGVDRLVVALALGRTLPAGLAIVHPRGDLAAARIRRRRGWCDPAWPACAQWGQFRFARFRA